MNRYRLLLQLLLEHWLSYTLGSVMIGLTLWMSLAIPLYLEQAIDLLRTAQPAAVDSAADTDQQAQFNRIIAWILGFAVAIIFTRTASRLLFFIPGRRVEYDLKNRLLAHLTTLQRDYFLANPTGAIISRINNDINGVRMLMGFGLLQLANSLALLSLAPYQMYLISPRLTVYVALPLLASFIVPQLALRRLRRLQQTQQATLQTLSDYTVESYNGLDTLRSYRALGWAQQRFTEFSAQVRDLAIQMATIRAFFMPILSHIVNALKALLVLFGGIMVINAELSMGEFVAFTLLLSMLLPPLMGLTFMMFVVQRGMTALSSLETVFATQPTLPAQDKAYTSEPERAGAKPGLTIRNLRFAYPDAPHSAVLSGIDFEVRPGEIVGVFGAIGSGKTTLVNLINRYLTPPPGSILLHGQDIRGLSLERLRRQVVTVSQEPFLFSASIGDNVRFGVPLAAEAADEALLAALRAAAMETDLARFPAGLDTIAGERGINLSGGQKQRIALARALLKPCELLILDDVMSAVDTETERYLIKNIYNFQHAKALLIISHRLSVLQRADRIIVLDQGRMVAIGSHAKLIRQAGSYRDAYQLQNE